MKFSLALGIVLPEGEIGDVDDSIVAIVTQKLLAFVQCADDLESVAIDVDALADGIFVLEQTLDDVGAQDGHVPAVEIVHIRVEAAILQFGVASSGTPRA